MSVFVRPGPVCAADRRESRFDNAFHRANSQVLFNPLPVGLGGSGLSRRAGSSQQTVKELSGLTWEEHVPVSTATVTMQGAARYKYRLSVKKKLSNYGMEQQTSLLSDYYILIFYGYSTWEDLHDCKNPEPDIFSVYQAVLSDFLRNPADRSVL